MDNFHPVVTKWFSETFDAPTQPQLDAWAAISKGNHALVAAPTGSGKTLAAFLTAIDTLVKQLDAGTLKQQVSIIYVSPLKALSNDIHLNLEKPLTEIQALLVTDEALESGFDIKERSQQDNKSIQEKDSAHVITSATRTGDTTQWSRTKMLRTPPNILVTTPESLFILLTSQSGRTMLSTANTLIIDEIHAMVGSKRGAHLALSMERLQGICPQAITRIGLSATQEPIETVAHFLTGSSVKADCQIIDSGHQRNRDIEICLPPSPLEAVMAGEVWGEMYSALENLIDHHTTTLIFVNTRRLAERVAKALAERLGEDTVTSHHGSLAKEHRFSAEQRLKKGQIKALVTTTSLELGIDIGDVDLVCQIGSPRAVSVFLQRVGRSGHSLGKTPKGRLFPLSRDDLVECVALLDAIAQGELDQLTIYPKPLDVLAQQIVAEISAGERLLDDLFNQVIRAAPYQALQRRQFDDVIEMLSEGFSTRRGRRSAYLHLDKVNGKVKPRKSARLAAITNGGTIPDQFDYEVVLQPEGLKIGSLNEDFAFESLPGDVFQLGNTSYQILKVELGKVLVRDAAGQPPNIPFWFGEAPGRTDAISYSVSRLRINMEAWLSRGMDYAKKQLEQHYHLDKSAIVQLTDYLGAAYSALGALPSMETVIFERFFDEAGDQHLVVHSSFGSRLNRAWGLALRKRFCRKFNFELQAAALEDTIVLSLGSTHSFPLDEPASYLKSATVEDVLTQALLDAPMFPTHWRWNASIALAIRRFSNGKKTPPQFQRSNAEDLIAVVFPDQIACAENIAGKREIPDHPLVTQTLYDCLHDLMDVDGLKALLDRLAIGNVKLVCKDLSAPSPLSEEVLTAKPYAFLDDAPAEERRTGLVRARQFLQPEDAAILSRLDANVIDQICQEAWPIVRDYDECHDALMTLGGVSEQEALKYQWDLYLDQLAQEQRACYVILDVKTKVWVAAERLEFWEIICQNLSIHPEIRPVKFNGQFANKNNGSLIIQAEKAPDRPSALIELVRMRLQGLGPVFEYELQAFFRLSSELIQQTLIALEQEGYVMRGQFIRSEDGNKNSVDGEDENQWCERGLLARIHRRTIQGLRKQIKPVSVAGFMRYLFAWHGMDDDNRSEQNDPDSLLTVLEQLEGLEIPAGAWEESVLPVRLQGYMTYWLDMLCSSGKIAWMRLSLPANPHSGQDGREQNTPTKLNKQSPITLLLRNNVVHWRQNNPTAHINFDSNVIEHNQLALSHRAKYLYQYLADNGAQFFNDLAGVVQLNSEIEQGLSELASMGLVTSDHFSGLRALIKSASAKQSTYSKRNSRNRSSRNGSGLDSAGRWSLVVSGPPHNSVDDSGNDDWQSIEYIAKVLLRRYGIVFRQILKAENNLPNWRELQYVYRRMEARGEVRGGRFVEGMAGEQFALPEVIGLVRESEKNKSQNLISISAADPLNLTGSILPNDRVGALRNNRILFKDGVPIAALVGGEIKWFVSLDQATQWQAQQKLIAIPAMKPGRYRHHKANVFN